MFVPELTRAYYPTKEELAEDVVALLRDRARRSCASAGADFVQFDEPVLTELAFAPGRTRTFMCAALAARRDPAEELEFAVSLINRVVDGRRRRAARPARLPRQLEPRRDDAPERRLPAARGRISSGCRSRSSCSNTPPSAPATSCRFEGKELGLGVVNPRTDQVETPEQIRAAVEEALRLYPAERVFLNPDCGFGTFSNRPMNTLEIASAKVASMAAAARDLRGRS